MTGQPGREYVRGRSCPCEGCDKARLWLSGEEAALGRPCSCKRCQDALEYLAQHDADLRGEYRTRRPL